MQESSNLRFRPINPSSPKAAGISSLLSTANARRARSFYKQLGGLFPRLFDCGLQKYSDS